MSGLYRDSHFLRDLDWSELSQCSPLGRSADRQADIAEDDQIRANLLDQIRQSITEDECEEQFLTVKPTKSNLGGPSNSYSNQRLDSIHSCRLNMQLVSPKVAVSPRDDYGLSPTSYYEAVSRSKRCNSPDSSEFDSSSPCSARSPLNADACGRLRDESQKSRSRNDTSELGQGKTRHPPTRDFFAQGGSAPKKANALRYHSLRRMAAMPAASAGVEFSGDPGMRAVFLRSERSRRGESRGTGVFLPPCVGEDSTDFHRPKPACSIALLPLRIIQVLNLNVENMRCHPAPRPHTGWISSKATTKATSRLLQQQHQQMYVMELTPPATRSKYQPKSRSMSQPRQDQQSNALPLELGLPTEWTY